MIHLAKTIRRAIASRVARFRAAREGIAAVEFAMILPLMMTMWLGTVEVGQAIAINRKSVLVARTLADLTARATVINNAEMTNIFDATTAVIAPYSTANLGMVVSSIKRNGANQNLVVWSNSRGPGVAARAVNSAVVLPAGLLTTANQTIIMAEIRYLYRPVVGWIVASSGITVDEDTYMVPRLVPEVARIP